MRQENAIRAFVQPTTLEKSISSIESGIRAWVTDDTDGQQFKEYCKEHGIEIVPTMSFRATDGHTYRWYYRKGTTIQYHAKYNNFVNVPIEEAVNPKKDYRFKQWVWIDGRRYYRY